MKARILLSIALILRLVYVLKSPPLEKEVWSDMAGYVEIANQVMAGKWNTYHYFQSIGYPFLIALLKHVSPHWGLLLALIQALLSFFTVWIFYRLTTLSFGEKIGLVALLIETFHFPWIGYTTYALPEVTFTFCLAVAAFFSYKLVVNQKSSIWASVGWGLSFCMALWLKGTHVFWGPLFLLGLIVFKKKKALVPCLIISSIVSLSVAGHALLTYRTIGRVQLSASAGGLNFVEGKCPSKENRDSTGYSWHSPLYFQLRDDHFKQWDRPFVESGFFMKEGLRCVGQDPFSLIQSLEGIPYLFFGNTAWPLNQKPFAAKIRLLELITAIFFMVGLTLYVRRTLVRGVTEVEVLVWITPVLSLFLCVYVFKSEIRFRGPFDGWMIPIALLGLLEMRRTSRDSMLDSGS